MLCSLGCCILNSCEQKEAATSSIEMKNETLRESQRTTPTLSFDEKVSGKNAYIHNKAICDIGDRRSGSAGYEKQIRYIEEQLRPLGWQCRRQNFLAQGVAMTNLIAIYRAPANDDTANQAEKKHSEESDISQESASPRPMLLSCHIDTKIGIDHFVGANDGASGAAALIEIARMLAFQPEIASQVEIIFLDGEESFAKNMTEEDGLYGSKWDVEQRKQAGALPLWQINLDMVGGRNIPIAPPILDTSDAMYAQYSRAIRELKLSPEQWTMAPSSYMDDHLPYLKAGVDSLNLIAHFVGSDWWHTEKDNMSIISDRSLKESCLVTLKIIKQILSEAKASKE